MLNQEAEQEMLRAFVAKTSYHQLPMFIVFANNEAIKNHTASKALKVCCQTESNAAHR